MDIFIKVILLITFIRANKVSLIEVAIKDARNTKLMKKDKSISLNFCVSWNVTGQLLSRNGGVILNESHCVVRTSGHQSSRGKIDHSCWGIAVVGMRNFLKVVV